MLLLQCVPNYILFIHFPYQVKAESYILFDCYSIFITIYTHFRKVTVVMLFHGAYFLQVKVPVTKTELKRLHICI